MLSAAREPQVESELKRRVANPASWSARADFAALTIGAPETTMMRVKSALAGGGGLPTAPAQAAVTRIAASAI